MVDKADIERPIIPKLLTGDEVAEILNISRSFAYQLMRRGEIPTIRLGRSVRVRPQDLDEFIRSNIGAWKIKP